MHLNHDYIEFILSELNRFEQVLTTLQTSLPRFGPHKFALAVKLLIRCIREAFIKESKQLQLLEPALAKEEAEEKIKKYMSILRSMHSNLLPYLESVDTSFIPAELQAALIDIMNKGQKELGFFFYPTWEHCYEFYGYMDLAGQYLDELSVDLPDKLKAELDKLPKWFVFIAYPRMESRNVLLHTLMIHEAAHLMEYEEAISSSLIEKVGLDSNSLNEVVNTFLAGEIRTTTRTATSEPTPPMQLRLKDFFPEDVVRSRISAESFRILGNWLAELACDLIATRISGPAYLFALQEFIRLAGVADFTDTHPAPHMRLKLVWEELAHESMNYLGGAQEIKELLEAQRPSVKVDGLEPNGAFHRIAYNSIQSGLAQLQQKVRDIVPDESAYKVKKFEDEVLTIVKHLEKGKAISDIWREETRLGERVYVNRPLTFVSLLNAGWLVKLSRRDQFYRELYAEDVDQKIAALDNLNELVLKAIEGSSTLRKWRAVEESDMERSVP